MNENSIALPRKLQHCLKLGTVHVLCADFFRKLFVDIVFFQPFHLAGFILFYGGNSDIRNVHSILLLCLLGMSLLYHIVKIE